MKYLILSALYLLPIFANGQIDTSQLLRAFPITSYIVDMNDSSQIVQLEMPEAVKLKEKQIGSLWGVYNTGKEEAVQKGYGKCYLIKGNYYYFAIGFNTSGLSIKEGDILYTLMDKTEIYEGYFPTLASHFIRLKDVFDEPFYDRYLIFLNWTIADENRVVDSIIKDIKFTGEYFIQNEPSIDKLITNGKYAGKKTLSVMTECNATDVVNFLKYMIVRPRIYAGKEWKIAELFATWISEGAPTIIEK